MIRKAVATASFALALFFGYLAYAQYFQWRGCFNAEGRCFDAETGVVYHAQSGMVWAGLAAVALITFLIATRRRV